MLRMMQGTIGSESPGDNGAVEVAQDSKTIRTGGLSGMKLL